MIITNETSYEEQVPHEPGQTFTFRYLTGVQMEQAEQRKATQAMMIFKDLPPDMIAAAMASGREAEDQQKDEPEDPYEAHDTTMVLNAGILAWSYEGEVSEDNISRLDGKTRMWAFRHLVDKNTIDVALGEDSDS